MGLALTGSLACLAVTAFNFLAVDFCYLFIAVLVGENTEVFNQQEALDLQLFFGIIQQLVSIDINNLLFCITESSVLSCCQMTGSFKMFHRQVFECVGISIRQLLEEWVPNMQFCTSCSVLKDTVFFDMQCF